MSETPSPKAGVDNPAARVVLGRELLLGIPEVRRLTGFGEATAAKLMKETGCCLKLHGRLYVIESSFFAYLHRLEVSEPCTL